MRLTLNKALQKGIEAHKAGRIKEADQYYTTILKAQPKHPDANHNMGVLAVSIGQPREALPFFKVALGANPNITQFWVSYIDALIKLDRMTEAKNVFKRAKKQGAKGVTFNHLEKRLRSFNKTPSVKNSNSQNLTSDQLRYLIGIYQQGKHQEALNEASKLLMALPNCATLYNIIGAANKAIGNLDQALEAYKKAISIEPNTAEFHNNLGNALKHQGKLEEAIVAYRKAISIKPNYWEAIFNMGNNFQRLNQLVMAIEAYREVILLRPDYAEAYNNMGIALQERGELDEAVEACRTAISIKPNYAEAYNNMGIALRERGELNEALKACRTAISIKPNLAKAYNSLGLILHGKGELDKAIEAYTEAISISSDYAEAYNNIAIALQDQGRMSEAVETYDKAFLAKPDYADAYWNRSGATENISEAKYWLRKCLMVEPNHLEASLTMCALNYYEGDNAEFENLLKTPLKNHPITRSLRWAFSLAELPPIYFNRWALFDQMIMQSVKSRPFYEFGVWRGEAFKYFMKTFEKGYGFDTFEGLPEDWHSKKTGSYSSEGNIPKIDGGEFIVGKFEDTLPDFFATSREVASIINFDADLYSSTICALNYAKSVIDGHTILIFDEFIVNEHWEQDEFKALEEFCINNSYTYEVLAISFITKQVAVKINEI